MIVFVIIAQQANFNYSKALIANKINNTELKFTFLEILKGYNLEKKLTKKQNKDILKNIDIVNIVHKTHDYNNLKKTIFSENSR